MGQKLFRSVKKCGYDKLPPYYPDFLGFTGSSGISREAKGFNLALNDY